VQGRVPTTQTADRRILHPASVNSIICHNPGRRNTPGAAPHSSNMVRRTPPGDAAGGAAAPKIAHAPLADVGGVPATETRR